MKQVRTALTIGMTLATLALAGGAALAQIGNEPAGPGPVGRPAMKREGGRMALNDLGRRLDFLTRRLNLTADQQTKIKPILEDQASQLKTIDETRLTGDERRAKLQELRTATFTKIQAILTTEQQKKHEELRERLQERRHKRVGGQPAPTVEP